MQLLNAWKTPIVEGQNMTGKHFCVFFGKEL